MRYTSRDRYRRLGAAVAAVAAVDLCASIIPKVGSTLAIAKSSLLLIVVVVILPFGENLCMHRKCVIQIIK